jgi:hypothetical protein
MCDSRLTLKMAACSSNKLTPPSVLEERACAPSMLAFGVQNMCVLGYESAPCEAPAPAKPPASSPCGILKKSKQVLGDATPSLATLTGTAEPSCPRVRFSLEERVHESSDATSASSTSSGRRRRRSEAEILKEWNMRKKRYYKDQPTYPKFQILKTDFRYPKPFKGEQPEDCKTKDPDYLPEHEPRT